MNEMLFLILDNVSADELLVGHDHSAPPSRCITTILDPEDNNMGDEAFVNPFDDFTEFEDVPY